jgi:hypothetical protein
VISNWIAIMNMIHRSEVIASRGIKCINDETFIGMQPFTSAVGRLICTIPDKGSPYPNSQPSLWMQGVDSEWYISNWGGRVIWKVNNIAGIDELAYHVLSTRSSFDRIIRDDHLCVEYELKDVSGLMSEWTYIFLTMQDCNYIEEVDQTDSLPPFDKQGFVECLSAITESIQPVPYNGIVFSYKSARGMIRFNQDGTGCKGLHPLVLNRVNNLEYSEDHIYLYESIASSLRCKVFSHHYERIL